MENPAVVPNLTDIALSVGERQMGPINGGPINLSSARLRHASLRFATLTGADLSAADLWDADLSDARLDRANLAGADLSEALLDCADFAGARLAGANLSGARLLEARNLSQTQIAEATGDQFAGLPRGLAGAPRLDGQCLAGQRLQDAERVPGSRFEWRGPAKASGNGVLARRRPTFKSWISRRVGAAPRRQHGLAKS